MADSNSELGADRRDSLLKAAALVAGSTAATLLPAQQPAIAPASLFKGFEVSKVDTTGAVIHVVSGFFCCTATHRRT